MLFMLDNYDSFTYNLVQYFGELGQEVVVRRNDQVTLEEIEALNPSHLCVSPGPKSPADAGLSVALIQHFAGKLPILGVCLGHQAIGQVFGGKIVRADKIMHGMLEAPNGFTLMGADTPPGMEYQPVGGFSVSLSGEDDTELAENRRILAALLRSDVQVRGDYNPRIFHQKFVLRDYDGRARPTSALLSGSANFTLTDTHRNLNHVFVFRSAFVCRQYLAEVEQLRAGSFGRGMHGDVPRVYDLGGVPVKVLFAPDHTPELEIVKQMLKGTEEIVFAIFTFAGSSGIDDAMLALARGGMKVRGVVDRTQAAHDWAAPAWLVHDNIELFVPRRTGAFSGLRKLHHKLMVIDEQVVVAGSFNYTAPANEFNDENIFVVGSVHAEVEGIEVAEQPCRVIARHLKAEVERIIALSEPWTPG